MSQWKRKFKTSKIYSCLGMLMNAALDFKSVHVARQMSTNATKSESYETKKRLESPQHFVYRNVSRAHGEHRIQDKADICLLF